MLPPAPPRTVLIVGCGEFGASAALSLIKGPYSNHAHLITIIDRASDPPAADAASSDLNKIVRQDYSDPVYADLALESIRRWRTPEWCANFYESGVMVGAGRSHSQANYVANSLALNQTPKMHTPGKRAYALKTKEDVRGALRLPGEISIPDLGNDVVYLNEAGGWADARVAVVEIVTRLQNAGVNFVTGEASELLFHTESGKTDVKGIFLTSGKSLFADLVILTVGSWTPRLVPELATECLPTGQVVAMIQLTEDEGKKYRDVPVVLFLDTGFYCFPPNADNIIKIALHDKGWTSPSGSLPSLPRTTLSPGFESQQIPAASVKDLKKGFARVYSELATKKWIETRICWYSDRPSGDWLLDFHPKYPSLFVAAGCSGHAFKFMPVIGDLIVDALSGKLGETQRQMWAFKQGIEGRVDGSRAHATTRLLSSSTMAKL